jgi:hypothetical protein
MEAETERLQQDSMTVEDTIGETMLSLVVAKRFISRLLRNNNVPGHLKLPFMIRSTRWCVFSGSTWRSRARHPLRLWER